MNSKYIKKCDLLKLFPRREFCFSVLVRSRITSAPTEEDVENVVRCKDCEHFIPDEICCPGSGTCYFVGMVRMFEDFCSYGERRATE